MSITVKAIIWATIIVSSALLALALDLREGAALGVFGGLSSAATGSLRSNIGCGYGGLQ